MFTDAKLTLMISDMNRAVEFYTETLGLPLKFRGGDEWAEIQAPGLTIALHPARERGPKSDQPGHLSIGFQVEQLETAMAALKEKGVEFAPHIIDDQFVRIAHFTDPDRTPLYLCEVKSAASYR